MSAIAFKGPPGYKNCVPCLYLCLAASLTSGEVKGAWSDVRSRMLSVFSSDTMRLADPKTVATSVIIYAFRWIGHNTCTVEVQYALNFPPYTSWRVRVCPDHVLLKFLFEVNHVSGLPLKRTSTTCTTNDEEDIEEKR